MGFVGDVAKAAINPVGTAAGLFGASPQVQAALNPIGTAANQVMPQGGDSPFRAAAAQAGGQQQPQQGGQRQAQQPVQNPLQPQQGGQQPQRFGHQAPGSGGMTQSPQGFDFRSPGVGEQFFNQQQGQFAGPTRTGQQFEGAQQTFGQPGQGEQYFNQVQGKFNQPRATQQQYQQFQARPEFGDYYDRAEQRTVGSMNDQLAARGAYGGSAGMDQIGQALADLNAQRANREADYALQAAQTGGQLAQAADANRRADLGMFGDLAFGAQGLEQQRAMQGLQGAQMADQQALQNTMSGMQAASTAQGLHRQRGRDYMSDLFAPTSALAGLHQGAMQGIIGGDQALLDSALGFDVARNREALNQDYRRGEQFRGDIGMLADAYKTGKTTGLF